MANRPNFNRALWTSNFDDATWTGGYREPKAVQLDDRHDQTEAEAQPLSMPALIRTVETPGYGLQLAFSNPGSRVADPHDDAFIFATDQLQLHSPAFWRELDGIVD